MKKFLILSFLVLCVFSGNVLSFEINLKNGDRISGQIVKETDARIVIDTEYLGRISILKEFLVDAGDGENDIGKEIKENASFSRKVSLGYSQQGGNTQSSQFSGEVVLNRHTTKNDWTSKITSCISTNKEEMDAKKFYGMTRYAYSFGDSMKWYNFYKFETDQDIFSNIDYRLVPSTGVGYWFSDKKDYKLMFETAAGYEYVNYLDNTKSQSRTILIPRGFFEKTLIGDLSLSQELIFYSSLEDVETYRLHSETAINHPISEKLSWKLSFVEDYNSSPAPNSKKNDYRVISSVEMNF